MTDEVESEAVLRIRVVEDLVRVARDLDRMRESTGDADREVKKLGTTVNNAIDDFQGLGKAATAAGKSVRGSSDGWSSEFKGAHDDLKRLNAEYQRFAQARAANPNSTITNPVRSLSSADQGRYLGVSSAANANAVSALREEESARARARRALADYDAQLNSNTVSYRASTSALAQNLIATEEMANQLPRLRYALYDVAQTAGIAGAAISAMGIASLTASASFESSFTAVERTAQVSGEGAERLREQLIGLTRDVPATFADVAGVATLGAQLNIASNELGEFSNQIIQFSATTGVSTDAAAEGFGRIGQLLKVPTAEYRNLGSAILYAGNTSVATEQDVLNYSQRLAIAGNEAGFTASEVVALSATLASLGIGLEAAQGATQRIFQQITRDVSEGGDALERMAAISGTSAQQFADSWRGDPQKALSSLVEGLARTGDLTAALDSIGIFETREVRAITALANNTGLYNQLLTETNAAYQQGTYLASSYGKVVDDLVSRWQIFLNAVMEFGAVVGDTLAPTAKVLLDVFAGMFQGFAEFASSDLGQVFVRTAAFAGILSVAILGIITAAALAGGAAAAMRTALVTIPWAAIAGAARSLGSSLLFVGTAGTAGSLGLARFRVAIAALGRLVVIPALIAALAQVFLDFGGTMMWVADVADGMNQRLVNGLRQIAAFTASIPFSENTTAGITAFADNFEAGSQAGIKGMREWAKTLPGVKDEVDSFGNVADGINWDDYSEGATDFGQSLGDVGGGAAGAQKEIRTLVDYAGDLSSVMTRAFDIRYGPSQSLDTITSSWQSIANAARDAAEAADEHRRKLVEMGADRSIKEYWLSVAENYGDELRAAKLRAELAELSADMASEQKKLTKEQDKASMSLVGNNEAAIENRAGILGLVTNYQSYLQALAASGVSQVDLQAKSAELKREFIAQAMQMGYNRHEIDLYAQSFEDMSLVIERVPRNVTVTANVNPALQALGEYEAKLRSISSQSYGGGNILPPNTGNAAEIVEAMAKVDYYAAAMNSFSTRRPVPMSALDSANTSLSAWKARLTQLRGYATGGYVGDGGKYEPKGIVHGGEFVFSKEATNFLGRNNLSYMHTAAKSGKSAAPTGLGAASGMSQLSPYDRQLLMEIRDAIRGGLSITEGSLQGAVNGANTNGSQRRAS